MAQLAVGDVLEDRYRVDHPIARGGMSTVYRCVDIRLGRAVAVKVLDDKHASDPVFRSRFLREARAMANLSHPNLLNVHDRGEDGEHVFLVMELIVGGTLRELLAERGPMPPHAALSVMRSMLKGLSAAHRAGLVHRDIKPDNVLINHDHTVKLADFGLVRTARTTAHTTEQIVGTVAYLSPEQVDGSEITPASDVYSAGIVLFELLTGTTPFSGDNALAHAYARLNTNAPAPSSRINGIPSLIDALVATATDMQAGNRFADADEFLEAVESVAKELQLPDYPVPVPTNSAANRAAAVPTSITEIVGPATGVLPATPAAPVPPVPPSPPAELTETAVVPVYPPPPLAASSTTNGVAPLPERVEQVPSEIYGQDPDPEISNRSPWRLVLWLVFITLLAAAVAVGGWWFGSGRYGEIPQVLGMERTAALSAIEEAGFSAATALTYSDNIPANHIAGTDPADGEKLVRGQEVTLLISQGQPTVPSGAGMDVLAYRDAAEERTLQVVTGDPVYSAEVEEGKIAYTEPGEGTAVLIGSTVTLHLSRGPEPVQVPSIIGEVLDSVREQLAELGLHISDIDYRYQEGAGAASILEVSPGVGTALTRGSEVSLVVNNALEIPQLSGLSLTEAQSRLEAAGFEVGELSRDRRQVADSPSTVVESYPLPGTLMDPEDAVVDLTLPGVVRVPDVVGMSVAQARATLADYELDINVGSNRDERQVTAQRPAAGSEARVGSTVRLSY